MNEGACGPSQDLGHSRLASPTTLIELRNFLGLANFYHRFMLGFSHITFPLSQVTKGGVKEKFFWSESQQNLLSELKHCYVELWIMDKTHSLNVV